jgi:hypothetical protein
MGCLGSVLRDAMDTSFLDVFEPLVTGDGMGSFAATLELPATGVGVRETLELSVVGVEVGEERDENSIDFIVRLVGVGAGGVTTTFSIKHGESSRI